jgi:hypothetical protein
LQPIAAFVSDSHLSYFVPQPGVSLGIDKRTNSQYRVSILVQHPALTARDNRQRIPFLSH